jgi:AcrR family transcriptional regulator
MSLDSVRPYSSALRSEQAATTRRKVLETAGRLFAERGYHGTSLGAIAKEAGVSIDTVQATGPKRDLLVKAFEVVTMGVETSDPLADAPGPVASVLEIEDLDSFVVAATRLFAETSRRNAALLQALRSAAVDDEAIREVLRGMLGRRRRDYRGVLDLLAARGAAVPADRRDRIADELAWLLAPEGYTTLVVECGWSFEDYAAWLAEQIRGRAGAGAFRT